MKKWPGTKPFTCKPIHLFSHITLTVLTLVELQTSHRLFRDYIPQTPTRLKLSSKKILNPIAFGYTNTLTTYQSDGYITGGPQELAECHMLAC